jgi:AcrR family transcriptional regulator
MTDAVWLEGPGLPGMRERKKQEKLRRIAEAAWAMFQRDGFEATTTRAVAETAGVAAGTLFLYARDKNDLLVLAFRDALSAAFDDAVCTMPVGKAFVQDVMHLFGAMVALHERHRALAAPLVKEWLVTGEAREPMAAVTRRIVEAITEQVTAAQQAGEIDVALAPTEVATACLGLYHASLTLWLGGWLGEGDTPEAHLRRQITLLARGLAAGISAGIRRKPDPAEDGGLRSGAAFVTPRRVTIFGDNDEFVD